MLYAVILACLLFAVIFRYGAVSYSFHRIPSIEHTLLEGATLSDIPPLHDLLNDAEARDAIRANVVAIGFDPSTGSDASFQTAEICLFDDGGGVHILKKVFVTSLDQVLEIETKAIALAKLFDVTLRTL